MQIDIRRAVADDAPMLRDLACEIWFDHYPGIISRAQIHYMLERGYAPAAIATEIARGIEWRVASVDGSTCGFAAWEAFGREAKLHKLYVRRALRVRGVGSRLVDDLGQEARRRGVERVYLAVNKRNRTAIRAYLGMGFAFRRAMRADIGHGFVMDDYEMAKPI